MDVINWISNINWRIYYNKKMKFELNKYRDSKGRFIKGILSFWEGEHLPREVIEKIKQNAKTNPNYGMKGKNHLEKTKNKIRESLIGHKVTEETRKRIKEKLNARFNDRTKVPMFGKHHSEKTKTQISENLKKKYGGGYINPRLGSTITEETRDKLKKARAKQIVPKKDTSIEVKIQNFLKQLGIDFFTHQYMKEIEHGYQCDILIPSMNLVIECDGDYWHKYPIGNDLDHIRTKELLEKGFRVLRLWECEIRKLNIYEFKQKIKELEW